MIRVHLVFLFLSGFLFARALGATANVQCAIIQYTYQDADSVGVDDQRAEGFFRQAADSGAKIVVIGETCFYRYCSWDMGLLKNAADEYDNLKAKFAAVADELDICIVVGLREPSPNPSEPVYNTALFFGPNGSELGKHRKMIPSNCENSWTEEGSEANGDATPFDTPYGRVGMLICKDMDSNTWPDKIAAKGMDLFIAVNGDPTRGWVKAVRACQQASCYGIGVNLYGHGCDGNSGFVDTAGKVISEAHQGEKIIFQSLSLPTTTMPDTTPPSAPAGLAATLEGETLVRLSWNPASDPQSGISGYHLYRRSGPTGTFARIVELGEVTVFNDGSAQRGATSQYTLTAVNGEGLEGATSDTVSVVLPASVNAVFRFRAFSPQSPASCGYNVCGQRVEAGVRSAPGIMVSGQARERSVKRVLLP